MTLVKPVTEPSGTVDLFWAKTAPYRSLDIAHEDRVRLKSLARMDAKDRFASGRALLRYCLERVLGLAEQQRAITIECQHCGSREHGKPSLPAAVPWRFSLSHAGSWVALALSPSEVGLDVESINRVGRLAGTVPPSSNAFQEGREKALAWTRFEAASKLGGAGLRRQADESTAEDPHTQRYRIQNGRIAFLEAPSPDFYVAHVATQRTSDERPLRLRTMLVDLESGTRSPKNERTFE